MGAGGILLCSHRATRGFPVRPGPRESGHQLPLSVPQHLALPHLLTEGRGGMNFLVPFPGFNGKVKAKYNTCLQLCQNGRQPRASAHLCCSSLPDLTVAWALQVSSAGNHIKDTRTSWPVSNQHVTRWSLLAMTWTLEPSFSLSPSLTVVLFNEF